MVAAEVLQGVDNPPGAVGPTDTSENPQLTCHQARRAKEMTHGSAGNLRRGNYNGMCNGVQRSSRSRSSGRRTKGKARRKMTAKVER